MSPLHEEALKALDPPLSKGKSLSQMIMPNPFQPWDF